MMKIIGKSGVIHGIICMVLGTFVFVVQDAMMKMLLGSLPLWNLICSRSILTIIILMPIIVLIGLPHRLFTPLWPLLLCRAALFATGFTLYYTAFPFMSLANVSTIIFAAPLITAVLASILLNEKVGLHRVTALIIGFFGVILAINPIASTFTWVSILPLICAITYSISQIITRKIGTNDTTITVGLYTIAFAGAFIIPIAWSVNFLTPFPKSAPHLRWDWNISSLEDAYALGALGLVGMIAYLLITRAYQVGQASAISPFEYIYLPLAAILGYVGFNEIPKWNTVSGMILIVTSSLYIGYRELISHQREQSMAPTAEASFIPGTPPTPHNEP